MKRERKEFENQVFVLKEVISHLNLEHKKLNNQLLLSDELKQKITSVNQTLSQNLYELNMELFEENFPKRTN